MLAKALISDVIPFLRSSDTGKKALTWMEIFRISHLPLVNNLSFEGVISDSDIYDLNDPERPLGEYRLSLFKPFVFENQHVYEVIETVSRMKLTIIPVLDKEKKYLGVIPLYELLQQFGKLTAIQTPGAIIVLELHINDYSLSEIGQIVEGNNAKILSLYVEPIKNTPKIKLNIKLNTPEISSVVETFNRYDYNITDIFMSSEDLDGFYKNRYESFLSYLNV